MHEKPSISVTQLAELLQSHAVAAQPAYVLDIREDAEWAQSHISHPAVHHMPMSRLEPALENLPHGTLIPVLCRSGGRSERVTAFLCALGFNATNVAGGMLAWREEVDTSLPPVA